MTGMDMIGFSVAVAAALECITGRLAKLDRRRHRLSVIATYVAQACICILAGSLTWQGQGVWALDMLSLVIAGHLVLTWEGWRHGPPPGALRDDTAGMVPVHADSRQEDGR